MEVSGCTFHVLIDDIVRGELDRNLICRLNSYHVLQDELVAGWFPVDSLVVSRCDRVDRKDSLSNGEDRGDYAVPSVKHIVSPIVDRKIKWCGVISGSRVGELLQLDGDGRLKRC